MFYTIQYPHAIGTMYWSGEDRVFALRVEAATVYATREAR